MVNGECVWLKSLGVGNTWVYHIPRSAGNQSNFFHQVPTPSTTTAFLSNFFSTLLHYHHIKRMERMKCNNNNRLSAGIGWGFGVIFFWKLRVSGYNLGERFILAIPYHNTMTGTFRLLDVDIDAASSCLLTFGTVFNFDHDEERVRYGYADESIMITSSKKIMNREVVLSRRTLPVNKEFFVIFSSGCL